MLVSAVGTPTTWTLTADVIAPIIRGNAGTGKSGKDGTFTGSPSAKIQGNVTSCRRISQQKLTRHTDFFTTTL